MATNLIKRLSDLTSRLSGARSALRELHGADRELRDEHGRLTRERSRLVSARPPKAELLATLEAEIASCAARWRERNTEPLLDALGGSLETPGSLAALAGYLDFDSLCALAPDVVRVSLTALVSEAAFVSGPTMAERPQLIADIDAKIQALEAEHARLVNEAAAVGITLEFMPAERARRYREQQHRGLVDRHNLATAAAIRRGTVEPLE